MELHCDTRKSLSLRDKEAFRLARRCERPGVGGYQRRELTRGWASHICVVTSDKSHILTPGVDRSSSGT
jgi:hypothetical protein